MTDHTVVPRQEWTLARQELLRKEKEFTRLRDALNRDRRALPWERVDKPYRFEGPGGALSFADLFDGCSQLIVQHFMMGPDWQEGCTSCSFWADNFDGVAIHLKHRDVTLALVSRAPVASIEAYRKRMGWNLRWVSSLGSDFNFDFDVSFAAGQVAAGNAVYNYARLKSTAAELPGVSVFYKDGEGNIFHTYSAYARGLDALNGAYQLLDLVPKGRDEAGLPYGMAWLRRHDAYET